MQKVAASLFHSYQVRLSLFHCIHQTLLWPLVILMSLALFPSLFFFFLELLCSLFAQCHVLHKPLAFSFSYQCTTHIHFRHFSSHFFLRHWCPAPLCVTKCFVLRLLLIMDFWLIIPG